MKISRLSLFTIFILLFSMLSVKSTDIQSIKVDQTLETPNRININGNQDLIAQARQYGWDNGGLWDGTANYPFRIQNLYLTYDGINLPVYITDTSLHLYLENVTVDGANNLYNGMYIFNSHHITILRSSIVNLAISGRLMDIEYSENIRVIACNFVEDGSRSVRGIQSYGSNYSMFYSNSFTGYDYPIELYYSNRSVIDGNQFYDNPQTSIWLYRSEYVNVENNLINNSNTGIEVYQGRLIFIRSNTLNHTSYAGIYMYGMTQSARISHNILTNSLGNGIVLSESPNNLVTMNIFMDNANYGLYMGLASTNNVIEWNSFQNNLLAHIGDSGAGNVIYYNYYNDHTGYDYNYDNFEDSAYSIYGDAGNWDYAPLSLFHTTNQHRILAPSRISVFTGSGQITWDPLTSNYLTDVYYNIFYRPSLSDQWITAAINYYDTIFTWDVSGLEDGQYQIRIAAIVNGSISTSDSSREFFVRNQHLSQIRLYRPNYGVINDSNYEIRWSHAYDLNLDPVTYAVYLSPNNGLNWEIIGSNIQANYLVFDFSSIIYSSQYRIKVVASDGFGYSVEDISDEIFAAGTTPTSSGPSGSDTSGSISPNPDPSPSEEPSPSNPTGGNSSTQPGLPVPILSFSIVLFGLMSIIFIKRR